MVLAGKEEMVIKSKSEIMKIIQQLEHHIADDFEAQDLDFKQWNFTSREENIQKMIKYAVCMANGGGGSVVFGVADNVRGIDQVLVGIPFDIDIQELEKRVYRETDPPILPTFDEIFYQNHSIRLLVMNIFPGEPPYTVKNGIATIRTGKECLPIGFIKTGKEDFNE
ncbi:ATP-binding protein [Sporosarcina sp. HYO08]|uniref:ATP-binding protein n=1 Tax=Sporosarcina sp. HYO08 TaxID=1759557 RepID=UPI0012E34FE9|nr:ATP-binding protein [Sporosarcina sp. HYO08]